MRVTSPTRRVDETRRHICPKQTEQDFFAKNATFKRQTSEKRSWRWKITHLRKLNIARGSQKHEWLFWRPQGAGNAHCPSVLKLFDVICHICKHSCKTPLSGIIRLFLMKLCPTNCPVLFFKHFLIGLQIKGLRNYCLTLQVENKFTTLRFLLSGNSKKSSNCMSRRK